MLLLSGLEVRRYGTSSVGLKSYHNLFLADCHTGFTGFQGSTSKGTAGQGRGRERKGMGGKKVEGNGKGGREGEGNTALGAQAAIDVLLAVVAWPISAQLTCSVGGVLNLTTTETIPEGSCKDY